MEWDAVLLATVCQGEGLPWGLLGLCFPHPGVGPVSFVSPLTGLLCTPGEGLQITVHVCRSLFAAGFEALWKTHLLLNRGQPIEKIRHIWQVWRALPFYTHHLIDPPFTLRCGSSLFPFCRFEELIPGGLWLAQRHSTVPRTLAFKGLIPHREASCLKSKKARDKGHSKYISFL